MSETWICGRCGANNWTSSPACHQCQGPPSWQAPTTEMPRVPGAAPAPDPTVPPQPPPFTPAAPGQPPAGPPNRTALIAVAASLVLLLVAAGLVLVLRPADDASVAGTGPTGTQAAATTPLATATTRRESAGTTRPRAGTTSTTRPLVSDLPPPVTRPSGPPAAAGGTLVVGIASESSGWSPVRDQWEGPQLLVAQTFYDPLFAFDAAGEAKPYLASAVSSNAEHTEWTIELRPDIEFHDGTPADATAVKRQLDAAIASPLVGVGLRPVASVAVVDDLTVKVSLSSPWAVFPAALTGQVGMLSANLTDDDAASRQPIGTGPFVLDSWTRDNNLEVTKNEAYWQKGLPYLDAIEFRVLVDDRARYQALTTGDIDVALTADPDTLASVMSDDGFQYVVQSGNAAKRLVVLNTALAPFDDPEVRLALALAIDQDEINDARGSSDALVDGTISASSPWHGDAGRPRPNPEESRARVQEYTTRTGRPLAIELAAGSDPQAMMLAQLVQQQWKQVGIEASITTKEHTALLADLVTGNFEAALTDGFGQTDPDQQHVALSSETVSELGSVSSNLARFADPAIDDALQAARASADPAARKAEYAAVQARLAEQAPYVWLTSMRVAVVARDRVRGLANGPLPDGSASLPYDAGAFRLTSTWLAR